MSKRAIPVVDLSQFVDGNADQRAAFVQQIGNAFHEIGFVGVKNHGISPELIDDFYNSANAFFGLDVDTKRKYEVAGLAGQRGYTSFGTEHAKQSKVADLKEFFQLGQYVAADHPLKDQYPDNVQVAEKPEFAQLGKELYQSFEKAGAHLLKAIAIFLELPESYFDDKITWGSAHLLTNGVDIWTGQSRAFLSRER